MKHCRFDRIDRAGAGRKRMRLWVMRFFLPIGRLGSPRVQSQFAPPFTDKKNPLSA
jgi:hypothetical protein